ncbi:dynein regulatory complex subunit 2 [Diachasma alloeum]|uniref:dynein regulatory complex subunit 2 n=1 Tax=Diachasma alloeum TaxID=454923 RepID=UPI00073848EB|nr:dynein regulatory complex subunit 2 [Diachasma alloeum]
MESRLASDQRPKNKSKAKKPGGTSEERKALLKLEALTRERKMGTRNNEQLRRSWMKIMAEVKIPTMEEDIEVSRNIFERTLDIKDYRAHCLVEGLDDSEIQYKRNIGGHVGIIKRLEDIYNDRSTSGYDNYKRQLDGMIQESETDVKRIISLNDESEGLLQSIMKREEKITEELLESLQSETAYKLDNLREDGSHSIKMALIDIENRIKFYWNSVNSIITNYSNDTHERRVSYEALKAKDTKDRGIIADQLADTAELYDAIRKYQEKIKKLEGSSEDTAFNINIERKLSREAYSSMKERFLNEQTIDKTQVTHMTREYNLTLKSLRRLVKKAQSVLACMRMCRKFEAQVDKLLPARWDSVTAGHARFDYFWRRVGEAQVETRGLRDERTALKWENECLKKLVNSRIQGRGLGIRTPMHSVFREEKKGEEVFFQVDLIDLKK